MTATAQHVPLDVENISGYPVGTTVRWTDGTSYVKTRDNYWERRHDGGGAFQRTRTDARWEGAQGWHVESGHPVHQQATEPVPQVGETPGTVERLALLPVGSVLCDRERVFDPVDEISATWRREPEHWAYFSRAERLNSQVRPDEIPNLTNLSGWCVHTVGTPTFEVGQLIETLEQYAQLPVGSRLSSNGGTPGNYWRKDADGWREWRTSGTRLNREAWPDQRLHTAHGARTLLALGDHVADPQDRLNRMDVMTRAQFDALPVGSVVRDISGTGARLTKLADGEWEHENSGPGFRSILEGMVGEGRTGLRFWAYPDTERDIIQPEPGISMGGPVVQPGEMERALPGSQLHRIDTEGDERQVRIYRCVAPDQWERYHGLAELHDGPHGAARTATWRLDNNMGNDPSGYRWDTFITAEITWPQITYTGERVPTDITTEQLSAAPVGSIISLGAFDSHYRRTAPDTWERWVQGDELQHTETFDDARLRERIHTNPRNEYLWECSPTDVTAGRPQLNVETGQFTAPGCPAVGGLIDSNDQLAALPVGSVIRVTERREGVDHYVKTRDGERYGIWANASTTPPHEPGHAFAGRFTLHGYNTVVRVGPEQPDHPAVGEHITSIVQVRALPVGSVLRSDGGNHYVKTEEQQWHYAENTAPYAPRNRYGSGDTFSVDSYNQVVRVGAEATAPAVSGDAQQRVRQAMDEVRDAIDGCVRYQRYWGWVRDGAFRLLGMDPMPAVDSEISYGSAFGLPVGSVIRCNNSIFQVTDNGARFPELIAGPGYIAPETSGEVSDYMHPAQVLLLGDWTPPTFTGRNNFIHKVWQAQHLHRGLNRWCSAVESCLNNADLPDPGETPDPEETVVTPPPVGPQLIRGSVVAHVDAEYEAALNALPVGSTVYVAAGGPGICILTANRGWVRADTVERYTMAGRVQVRVESIPRGATAADDEEPF